ncbi:MAG: putative Co/Zn/Cd efflux system rane fusion protein [bacterium]|nr:putative Co/Zn/Cd efflux system rane fusion protein [bacterium]
MRRPAATAVLFAVALGCHSSRSLDEENRRVRVVPVLAAVVEERDVPIFLDGLGTVVAYKTIAVHSQVDGRLLEVHFREGQRVKRGELLALVDPDPFIAQLHQAEGALIRDQALLHDSKLNLARNIALRQRNLIAQQNVDDQRALVGQYLGATRVDEGQIENARLNIRYAHIASPVDGVCGIRLIDPGNIVHSADATGIVIVTQIDPIAVLFTLPQDDLPTVVRELRQRPLPLVVLSRDGATRLGEGRVEIVDNQINQTTATIRLKAVAPNPEGQLWPNQFVKARLLVATRAHALVVPSTAVQRGPNGTFAYVINPDDTVAVRRVQPELTTGDVTIVRGGLQPGERVVVEGQNELSPGSRVSVRLAAAAAAQDGGEP